MKKTKQCACAFALAAVCMIASVSCVGSGLPVDLGEVTVEKIKEVMADGATLSAVRPSEHELSEEEIIVKVAKYVIDTGHYNYETAAEIDPRLPYAKIETPIYIYLSDDLNVNKGGFYILAVDKNNETIASITGNAEIDREFDNFIGSYGPYLPGTHIITKREASHMLARQFPSKEFTEPEMISLKREGDRFYSHFWYAAAVEKNGRADGFSASVAGTTSAAVEEYLIDSFMSGIPSGAAKNNIALSLRAAASSCSWGGIMKLDEYAGFYKVILANKTAVDSATRSAAPLDDTFSEYRGKGLKAVHGDVVKATKIELQ